MLEMRQELESLIGLKLDHIPDEQIIQWMRRVKHPFPELKSDIIYAIKKRVILNQIL